MKNDLRAGVFLIFLPAYTLHAGCSFKKGVLMEGLAAALVMLFLLLLGSHLAFSAVGFQSTVPNLIKWCKRQVWRGTKDIVRALFH